MNKSVLQISFIVIAIILKPCFANLDSGLVAYYQFNNNANDSTSNANNGTVHVSSMLGGKYLPDRWGNDSSSLYFNNSHVEIPDANCFDFTNSFSISAWTDASGTIFSKPRTLGGTGIRFAGGTGGLSIGLNNGPSNYMLSAPPTLANTDWHHVVVTYDGDSIKLFTDTVLMNAAEYQITFVNSSQPVFIGIESPELGQQFTGSLDDIKIYNRALSYSEIIELYGNYASSPVTNQYVKTNKSIGIKNKSNTYNLTGKKVLRSNKKSKILLIKSP